MTDLRWKKTDVLDDGFVCLVDVMGDESSILQAARVSYGKDKREGDYGLSDTDITTLRYLMRHHHTTPLEMVELKFLVRVPMDCWRQWIRHRTASVNEYSTRYTNAIDSMQATKPDEWRVQSTTNKQGSGDGKPEWGPEMPQEAEAWGRTPDEYLSDRERVLHENSRAIYNERLSMGIAREQARKDLPLSTYTEAYWKIDLHNLLHFLSLRMDSHAQKEIREYANAISEIVAQLFPNVWSAFNCYSFRRDAILLTSLDVRVIRSTNKDEALDAVFSNDRERDECVAKLERLGLM